EDLRIRHELLHSARAWDIARCAKLDDEVVVDVEGIHAAHQPIEGKRAGSDGDEDHGIGSRLPRYSARRCVPTTSGHWTYSRSAIGATSLADRESPSMRVTLSTY